jgi:hypothetical protein
MRTARNCTWCQQPLADDETILDAATTKPSGNSSATGFGKVVLCNGQTWRGATWIAGDLTYVRLPGGRVKAFGPKAVYSVDLGERPQTEAVAR